MKLLASGLLIAAALSLAVATASGSATAPTRHLLGQVPHHGSPHRIAVAPTTAAGFTCGVSCAAYETAISKYFTDVAAASAAHATDNVYSVANEYCQGTATLPPTASCGGSGTPITYSSAFGGSLVDGAPLPAGRCNDAFTYKLVTYADKYCLTDAQLRDEIKKEMTANGWTASSTTMFFIFTPSTVGVCDVAGKASDANECSTNSFCAYHDSMSAKVIYAVVPDDATIPGGGCDSGSTPVGSGADATLSSVSHEHNEAITDPYGDGWWTADGNENGDLCAYTFGASHGTAPNGQSYNQSINNTPYYLQEEYSNTANGCLQEAGGAVTPVASGNGSGPLLYRGGSVMTTNKTYAIYWVPAGPVLVLPNVTGTTRVGKTLKATPGAWSSAATFAYRWLRCSSTGTACKLIANATHLAYTPVATDRGHRLAVRVTGTTIAGSTVVVSAPTPVVKS